MTPQYNRAVAEQLVESAVPDQWIVATARAQWLQQQLSVEVHTTSRGASFRHWVPAESLQVNVSAVRCAQEESRRFAQRADEAEARVRELDARLTRTEWWAAGGWALAIALGSILAGVLSR